MKIILNPNRKKSFGSFFQKRTTAFLNPLSNIPEILIAFLHRGLTSFGGPAAHISYFRQEFVIRRRWLDEATYADLVGLCQFLPGPASSQVGFCLGVLRGGLAGGLVAWAAFTLPSALLLYAAARAATALNGPLATGLVHGLKLAAVAVVAQAVWGMSRTLTPDRPRAVIALAAAAASLLAPGTPGQLAAIILGAAAGLRFCSSPSAAPAEHLHVPVTRRGAAAALALFATLLAAAPLLAAATGNRVIMLFDAFYRSGALVFGGGHVVLPVLRAAVVAPGWVTSSTFLAGYGLAQAVPGPLFTLAAYLGAFILPSPAAGAATALIALSLPGLLLAYGALPFWHGIRTRPAAQAGMRGTNAAVVGILAAALYTPLCTSTIGRLPDAALAAIAFLALTRTRAPPWLVVAVLAAAGILLSLAPSLR